MTPQNASIVGEAIALIQTGDTTKTTACFEFLRRDSLDAPTFHAVLTSFTKAHYRTGEIALLRRLAKTNPYDYLAIPITGIGDWTHSPARPDGSYASSWPWRYYIERRREELILDACDFLVDSLGDDAYKFHPTSETEKQIIQIASLSRLFLLMGTAPRLVYDDILYQYLSHFPRTDVDTVLSRFRRLSSDGIQAALLQWRIDIGDVKVPWDAPPAKMHENYYALLDTITYAVRWSGDYPPITEYPKVSLDVLRNQPEVYGPIIAAWYSEPAMMNWGWERRHPEYLHKETPLYWDRSEQDILFKLGMSEPLTTLFTLDRNRDAPYWPPLELGDTIAATVAFPPDSSLSPDYGIRVSRSSAFRGREYFIWGADNSHPDTTITKGWFSTGLYPDADQWQFPARYLISNDSLIVGELIPEFDRIERYLDIAGYLFSDSANSEKRAAKAGYKADEIAVVKAMLLDWQDGIKQVQQGWSKWNTNPFPTPRLYSDTSSDGRSYGSSYEFVSHLTRRFASWNISSAPVRPMLTDSDGDGLSDLEESYIATSPKSADTDGDGLPDFQDKNPLCPRADKLTDRQWVLKFALENSRFPYRSGRGLSILLAPRGAQVELQGVSSFIATYDAKDSSRVVSKYIDHFIWYIPPAGLAVTGDSAKATVIQMFQGKEAQRWNYRFSREKFGWKLEGVSEEQSIDRESLYYRYYYNEVEEGC